MQKEIFFFYLCDKKSQKSQPNNVESSAIATNQATSTAAKLTASVAEHDGSVSVVYTQDAIDSCTPCFTELISHIDICMSLLFVMPCFMAPSRVLNHFMNICCRVQQAAGGRQTTGVICQNWVTYNRVSEWVRNDTPWRTVSSHVPISYTLRPESPLHHDTDSLTHTHTHILSHIVAFKSDGLQTICIYI